MKLRYKFEISAIYMAAVMLVISLCGLGANAVAANKSESITDTYTSLYVENEVETSISADKSVYFTFDDGPSRNTERILDVLSEENVKATFFVCAQCAEDIDVPAVLRRILAEGHEIGLHTYTHNYKKVYRSLDCYLEDLNAINNYIIDATGYKANIIRFPGGSGTANASPALMKNIIKEMTRRGYKYYDWDVDSGDSTTKVNSAKYIAQKIINGAKDKQRVIVLMHDSIGPKTTPEAVKLAIPALRDQGYVFDKLTASVEPKNNK